MPASAAFNRTFNTLLDNTNFCILCHKTESQIALVQPKHVKKLLKEFRRIDLKLSESLVCVYCEARAASARQLITSFEFAKDTLFLLDNVATKHMYYKQLRRYLNSEIPKSGLSIILRNAVTKCESQFKDVHRNKRCLCRTETLFVDLQSESAESNRSEKKTTEGSYLGEIVISDSEDDANSSVPVLTQPIIRLLVDPPTGNDESILPDLPLRSEPVNKSTEKSTNTSKCTKKLYTPTECAPPTGIQTNSNENTNSPALFYVINDNGTMTIHPMIQDQGNYIAPTLGSNDINNITSILPNKNTSSVHTITQIPLFTNTLKNIPKITYISPNTNPQIDITPRITYIPSHTSSPDENIQKQVRSLFRPPIRTNDKSVTDMNNDTKIVNNNLASIINNVNNGVSLPIITNAQSLNEKPAESDTVISKVDDEDAILRKRSLKEGSGIEPGGKKMAATDWEDKIPMDLISLADNPAGEGGVGTPTPAVTFLHYYETVPYRKPRNRYQPRKCK